MTRTLLIDANLLCLLTVGRAGRRIAANHPRLSAFDPESYDLLLALMDRFADVTLCPHVLTEASNLISYRQSVNSALRLRQLLANAVEQFGEHSVAAKIGVSDAAYTRLGLTDAVLLILAANEHMLVTIDLDLWVEASRRGLPCINFNHLRDGALTLEQVGQVR